MLSNHRALSNLFAEQAFDFGEQLHETREARRPKAILDATIYALGLLADLAHQFEAARAQRDLRRPPVLRVGAAADEFAGFEIAQDTGEARREKEVRLASPVASTASPLPSARKRAIAARSGRGLQGRAEKPHRRLPHPNKAIGSEREKGRSAGVAALLGSRSRSALIRP